jgi:hypothetical protein
MRWVTAEEIEARNRQYAGQAEAARQLAETDVAEGRLRFIYAEGVHYDPVEWFGEWNRLLKERLGVEGFVWYIIDAPNFDAIQVFEGAYNRHMSSAIAARFGADILERLRKEAQESYRRKQEEQRRARGLET